MDEYDDEVSGAVDCFFAACMMTRMWGSRTKTCLVRWSVVARRAGLK